MFVAAIPEAIAPVPTSWIFAVTHNCTQAGVVAEVCAKTAAEVKESATMEQAMNMVDCERWCW